MSVEFKMDFIRACQAYVPHTPVDLSDDFGGAYAVKVTDEITDMLKADYPKLYVSTQIVLGRIVVIGNESGTKRNDALKVSFTINGTQATYYGSEDIA
jgi:hypothetical protein